MEKYATENHMIVYTLSTLNTLTEKHSYGSSLFCILFLLSMRMIVSIIRYYSVYHKVNLTFVCARFQFSEDFPGNLVRNGYKMGVAFLHYIDFLTDEWSIGSRYQVIIFNVI